MHTPFEPEVCFYKPSSTNTQTYLLGQNAKISILAFLETENLKLSVEVDFKIQYLERSTPPFLLTPLLRTRTVVAQVSGW